jgi:hypothetical protein
MIKTVCGFVKVNHLFKIPLFCRATGALVVAVPAGGHRICYGADMPIAQGLKISPGAFRILDPVFRLTR